MKVVSRALRVTMARKEMQSAVRLHTQCITLWSAYIYTYIIIYIYIDCGFIAVFSLQFVPGFLGPNTSRER